MKRRAADYRQAERERIRKQIAAWWDELRALWAARRQRIDALALRGVEKAARVRDHERQRLRELGRHKRRAEAAWAAHKARERTAESDDEVVSNLEAHHPELVPVFRELRGRFRATPKMSRTEAVLHWAHDNPDEVMVRTAAREERELQRAIAEHEAAELAAHRHQRPIRKTGQPARRLAQAVPF